MRRLVDGCRAAGLLTCRTENLASAVPQSRGSAACATVPGRRWSGSVTAAGCLLVLLAACGSEPETNEPPRSRATAPAPPRVTTESRAKELAKPEARGKPIPAPPADGFFFTDITSFAGINFTHFNDPSPRKLLPETMGSGLAFFDYDNDGRPDLYFVNGSKLRSPRNGATHGTLYRNQGNLAFTDVTRSAGLDEPMFGMGAAVGDFDNDGFVDLFITGVDEDRLYRNLGDGTFADVTERFGLNDVGFGSSAAFLDYDRDGYLDIFVGRYVEWTHQTDIPCSPDGVHRVYCTPEVYQGQSNRLYKNLGGKKFKDVTRSSGIWHPEGKTLGVAVVDQNQDGWPDIAVANDTARNFLFLNNRDGTFSENGVTLGMAYSESGATRGGMGIDAADADADGYPDILVGNFSQEMSAFYRGSPNGFFVDEAPQIGIGLPTLMTLAFGTLFMDFDNDGLLDIMIANGHIEPEISKSQRLQRYAQPTHLFHNRNNGNFQELKDKPGSPVLQPLVSRGLATADIDGDGDLDVAISQNGRTARLWRNNTRPRSWIRVQLVGVTSNRTGYGATVKVVSGNRSWTRTLNSGRSYLSACEPILTIGLGEARQLDRLEITWPSGRVQTVPRPPLNRLITVKES